MLVRFSVQNFRSFKEQTSLSMVANGRLSQLKNHAMVVNDVSLLRGAFVYGANASGKSNLIHAVDFSRKIILEGSTRGARMDRYCKLGPGKTSPGVFQFKMLIEDKVYSYGFALSYLDGTIIEEWLYQLKANGDEKNLFSRNEETVSSDLNLIGKAKTRFGIYAEDIKSQPRDLFLSELAKKTDDDAFHIFGDVYHWFANIIVIFPSSVYMPLPLAIRNDDMRNEFEKFLVHFDTGIDSIEVESSTLKKELSHYSDEELSDLEEFISQTSAEHEEFGIRGSDMLLAFRRENDDLVVEKLKTKHQDAVELFDLKDESDGTKRLFDLVPLLFEELDNRVVFIDEIDRSMHPKLTVELVKLFYDFTEKKQMQMIATTHESALLDLSLLRRDEIWFVERQAQGSQLYSLDDFKVRYDKQIEGDYLLGRFGATPLFPALDSEY